MGLDMYLSAEKYISGWDHNPEAQKKLFKRFLKAVGISEKFVDGGSPSGTASFNIGYWRKANAVHAWFVKHVQGGEDECRKHSVSIEQLRELKETCESILAIKDRPEVQSLIEEKLPPQAGFFFGSPEVNEWYFQNLKDTIEIVERCEKLEAQPVDPKSGDYGWDFQYQSSW